MLYASGDQWSGVIIEWNKWTSREIYIPKDVDEAAVSEKTVSENISLILRAASNSRVPIYLLRSGPAEMPEYLSHFIEDKSASVIDLNLLRSGPAEMREYLGLFNENESASVIDLRLPIYSRSLNYSKSLNRKLAQREFRYWVSDRYFEVGIVPDYSSARVQVSLRELLKDLHKRHLSNQPLIARLQSCVVEAALPILSLSMAVATVSLLVIVKPWTLLPILPELYHSALAESGSVSINFDYIALLVLVIAGINLFREG